MRRRLLAGTVVSGIVLSGLWFVPSASAEEELTVKADISAPEVFLDSSGEPLTITSDTGQESDVRTITGTLSDGTPFSEQLYYGMPQDLEVGNTEVPESHDAPATGLEAQTIVARTATTLSVAWRGEGSSSTFEMFLDDTSLGQQDSSNFTVRGLSPSTIYSLRLNSTTPASEVEVRQFDEAAFQAKVDAKLQEIRDAQAEEPTGDPTAEPTGDPTAEPTGDPTAEPTTALQPARTATSTLSVETLPSASLRQARGPVAGGGSNSVESTDFTYRTFIPYRTIKEGGVPVDRAIEGACLVLASATYAIPGAPSDVSHLTFKGDDRSFQQPQESDDHPFRTQTQLHVDWEDGSSSTDKEPGYTQVFDEDSGEVVAERRANLDNVTFSRWGDEDRGYVRYNILHIANDPFCPSASIFGAITYNVNVDLYSTGLVKVYGWQYTMPSHEAWVRWNGSATWNNLFTSNATNLWCLIWGGLTGPAQDAAEKPTACAQPVDGRVNRTVDRWTSTAVGPAGLRAATTKAGRVWATGYGSFVRPYALGDDACRVNELVSPYRVEGQSPAKLALAWGTGLLLGSDGVLRSWGSGAVGGQPGLETSDSLAIVEGSYRDLVTREETAWAVNTDGDIVTWGFNIDYERAGWDDGNGLPMYNETPTAISAGHEFEQVAATPDGVTALDSDGHIWRQQDANGQGFPQVPEWDWVRIDGGRTFLSIADSSPGLWALGVDGSLWITGDNGYDTPLQEISGTDSYVRLIPSEMGQMVTEKIDGTHDFWPHDLSSSADAQSVTLPGVAGNLVDYWTFIASDGDLYTRSTDWDPDTGEAVDVWNNVGVPPTEVRSPDEVSYTCEIPVRKR